MEDRCSDLYLEMSDATGEAFASERLDEILGRESVSAATLWSNQKPLREDYPRTIDEFRTLAVFEVEAGFSRPADADAHRGMHYRRTPRPPQGVLSAQPTLGLEVVMVTPQTPGGAQALRDWADFFHIHEIAAAGVPHFTMITPYEIASGNGPRYFHAYEMDTANADAAFEKMALHTIEHLRPRGKDVVKAWTGHPELQIDYINAFARVGDVRR